MTADIKPKSGVNKHYIVFYIAFKKIFRISHNFKLKPPIISAFQTCRRGGMVDTSDSKSDAAMRAGSSPAGGTTLIQSNNLQCSRDRYFVVRPLESPLNH